MPTYRVEGIDIHVAFDGIGHREDASGRVRFDGPEEAPLVVFLHGALATGAAFRSQAVALRDRFRLALVDQRGHGASTHLGETGVPWGTLTAPQLTRDAIALLAQLSPARPVHLVGASLGGLVAARVASERRDLVASLALLGTSGTASAKRRAYFERLTPETLPRGTQLLSAKWHGEPYWRDLARHLFAAIVQQTIEVYPARIHVARALVMQAAGDEVLEPQEADAWAERIEGKTTLLRPPGDHAFFADGRAGSQAANAALRAHLLASVS